MPLLRTGQTQLGGASAGALLVACHHSGLPMELVTEACLKLAADCREQGTRGRLGVSWPSKLSFTCTLSCAHGSFLQQGLHEPIVGPISRVSCCLDRICMLCINS